LRLSARIPAELDAPAAGIFIHYVLEGVTKEIKEGAGFRNADEALCRELTERYVGKYIHEKLYDFEGRNARFIYLFRRLEEDVVRIVLDMMEELKKSEFQPLDFEVDISELAGKTVRGIVDRIDGWEHDGKHYLRVIDYKTGKKTFDLTDVLYGRDMQMLIYLFALHEFGGARYGGDIVPAGVLYVPARDMAIRAPRGVAEEELEKLREKEKRRSGLILHDALVIEAMESGAEKRYLPLKLTKDGELSGDSLLSENQSSLLSGHISKMLKDAAAEILDGDIKCNPYYKSENNNACLYCEYHAVCAFDAGRDASSRRYVRKMRTSEIWETLGNEE